MDYESVDGVYLKLGGQSPAGSGDGREGGRGLGSLLSFGDGHSEVQSQRKVPCGSQGHDDSSTLQKIFTRPRSSLVLLGRARPDNGLLLCVGMRSKSKTPGEGNLLGCQIRL